MIPRFVRSLFLTLPFRFRFRFRFRFVILRALFTGDGSDHEGLARRPCTMTLHDDLAVSACSKSLFLLLTREPILIARAFDSSILGILYSPIIYSSFGDRGVPRADLSGEDGVRVETLLASAR